MNTHNARTSFIALFALVMSIPVLAQSDPPPVPPSSETKETVPMISFESAKPLPQDPNIPVTLAEEKPVFHGGETAFNKELAKHLKYPQDALAAGIQGNVYLEYVVGVDGVIRDIKVKRGVFAALDKAAVEALKAMPPYEQPARIAGKPVAFQMVLPVMFKADK